MCSKKKASEKNSEVSIPTSLFKKIEKLIEGSEFVDVSDYVTYVLNEVLEENQEEVESLTEKDEEKIKARLKALGYVD